MSTQAGRAGSLVEQQVNPAEHMQEQVPPAHNPSLHATPQSPQWSGLVRTSTHSPSHRVWPGGQVHTPSLHTWPLGTSVHVPSRQI